MEQEQIEEFISKRTISPDGWVMGRVSVNLVNSTCHFSIMRESELRDLLSDCESVEAAEYDFAEIALEAMWNSGKVELDY